MKKTTTNRNMRILKIYPQCYPRRYNEHVNLPLIRLSGRWLEQIGFKIGGHVQVVYESGRMIITKVKPYRKK
ncbi:MAG: type I addiction module toxin, SymE family [Flavobacterium sp.]|nr:type I addiction module toxin, SymE family [Flavobacterium sp.]